MKLALPPFFQHCKRLSPLLAAPAALLLLQGGQAKAVLIYNIFESGGDVVVQTSGSLDLTGAISRSGGGTTYCGGSGALFSSAAIICTGADLVIPAYNITGNSNFVGIATKFPASNVSGITTILAGYANTFAIGPAYASNSAIVSSATFNTTTLATLGFNTTGLIGTWTLDGTSESIQVTIGAPAVAAPAASVPGPLPLFGVAAAFGWSRRLRKRIATSLSTPPRPDCSPDSHPGPAIGVTWTPETEPVLMRASLPARIGQEKPHESQTPQPRADHPQVADR